MNPAPPVIKIFFTPGSCSYTVVPVRVSGEIMSWMVMIESAKALTRCD